MDSSVYTRRIIPAGKIPQLFQNYITSYGGTKVFIVDVKDPQTFIISPETQSEDAKLPVINLVMIDDIILEYKSAGLFRQEMGRDFASAIDFSYYNRDKKNTKRFYIFIRPLSSLLGEESPYEVFTSTNRSNVSP